MNNEINDLLHKLPMATLGAILAMLIAALRVVYDDKETRVSRVLLEAALCGLLSLAASSAVTALGLDQNWAVFAGGVIGYLGSDTTRRVALKYISNKAGVKNEKK